MEEFKKYELTNPQKNIFMLEMLNEKSRINNLLGLLRIKEQLDIDILKETINKVIELNDGLRIRALVEEEKACQYIKEYEYEEIDTCIVREDEVSKIIDRVNNEVINLFDNKLYYFKIVQTSKEIIVLVKTHHLIVDAWSMNEMMEQIKELYVKIRDKRTVQEISYRKSYIDFIKNEEEYKKSDRFVKDETFWKEYVSNIECKNYFDVSKRKKGKRCVKTLNKYLFQKISKYCYDNGITEFSFFLAVISIYFSKILDTNKLIIGTPFLNRQKMCNELEILGMFISTLPINININSNQEIMDLCKEIAGTNFDCFKHCKYPYYEIQNHYQEATGEKINLYEVAFSYQINKLDKNNIDGDMGKNQWIYSNEQSNPMLISCVNQSKSHKLYYDYLIDCFSKTDVDRLHRTILNIINQILNGTNIVGDINVILQKDLEQLKIFNDTGELVLKEETAISIFENTCKQYKNKVALKYEDIELTYKDFNEKVNSLAYELKQKGVKKGIPVALFFDKSIEMFISIFAVLKAGGYYIPILPEEEEQRRNHILNDSNSKIVLTHKYYDREFIDLVIDVINVDKLDLTQNTVIASSDISNEDLSYIIYTSGSTGMPKGAIIKHKNLISLMYSIRDAKEFGINYEDVSISLLKYSFDAFAVDTYRTLLYGGKLVVIPKKIELDSEKVVKKIQEEKVNKMVVVPKWAEQIAITSDNLNIELDSLKFLSAGGESFKPKHFKKLLKRHENLSVYNAYGPTETTVYTTHHKINSTDIKNGIAPIGRPIPYVRALVVNSKNDVLPINIKGELLHFEDETSSQNIAMRIFKLRKYYKRKIY